MNFLKKILISLMGLSALLQSTLVESSKTTGVHCPVGCECERDLDGTLDILMVDCQSVGLEHMPPELPEADSYYLFFSENLIKTIPANLPYLEKVEVFDLSYNFLEDIDFQVLVKLDCMVKELFVDHNRLSALPAMTPQLKFSSLEILRIGTNPWRCECSTRWMRPWIMQENFIRKKRDILCHDGETFTEPVMAYNVGSCHEEIISKATEERDVIIRRQHHTIIAAFCIIAILVSVIVVAVVTKYVRRRNDKRKYAIGKIRRAYERPGEDDVYNDTTTRLQPVYSPKHIPMVQKQYRAVMGDDGQLESQTV